MSDPVGNEKIKLTATWLNGISIAVFAAGVVIPVVNQFVGSLNMEPALLIILAGICIVMAVSVHWVGLTLLGGLDVSDD